MVHTKFFTGALTLADPKIWVASFIPATVGFVLAVVSGGTIEAMDILWIFLAYVALALIETGKNGVNEYFDFIYGADPGVDEEHITPFSGGKKTVTSGLLTLKQVIIITVFCFAGAGAIGLAIVLFKRPELIYIGALGVIISIIYTLPPFKLCYRGFGELAVGFTFGPLVVTGAYQLITGTIDALPILFSLPFGLIIANVLIINEFPDYEADKAASKKNLVVRLGKKRATYLYGAVFLAVYACFVFLALYFNIALILPCFTAIIAWKAYINCVKNYDNISELIASNAATIKILLLTGLLTVISLLIMFFLNRI